jgi:hypothetical protein
MATVPRRGNFTRRKRRFSYVGKYEPSARPMTPGDETEDYSSAEEVDIDDVDHPKILLEARQEEENRAIAEKAARKSLEEEAKQKTTRARVLTVARAVANAISPGKKVTIKLKRRGESGGGSRGPKKHTKKHIKADSKHKQNKHTKRQPKRRD